MRVLIALREGSPGPPRSRGLMRCLSLDGLYGTISCGGGDLSSGGLFESVESTFRGISNRPMIISPACCGKSTEEVMTVVLDKSSRE